MTMTTPTPMTTVIRTVMTTTVGPAQVLSPFSTLLVLKHLCYGVSVAQLPAISVSCCTIFMPPTFSHPSSPHTHKLKLLSFSVFLPVWTLITAAAGPLTHGL